MIERFDNLTADFMISLRMDDYFDDNIYREIIEIMSYFSKEWKSHKFISKKFMLIAVELIAFLAGGSRFWDEETALKAEDAELRIMDIIYDICADSMETEDKI